MRMLAFFFAATLLIGATPAPSPSPTPTPRPIDAAAIDTITVSITVGALGPGARFHSVYHRRDPERLVSESGAVIEQRDLAQLVDALNEPPRADFDLSRSAIQPQLLTEYLVQFERGFLGPARTDLKVEAAFRKRFLDYIALKNGCAASMKSWMMVTDYYPHMTFVLETGKKPVVTIEDGSQREFFVPFTMTRDGVETTSFDPLVTSRIGALLPENAPLKSVMSGDAVLTNWAIFSAGTADLHKPFFECASIARPYAPYPDDSPSPAASP